ncbi:hypothetical protein Clacol_002149 [Clathrus columnatus]|uniref:Uncharacterized protein n=1 Tax=Clathrus columnatus TaxID=1419009 RepID=A0AAV5A2U7_9AGAM|nr:hypothetical protein Clacol_002149 [Clathrus columnatus]
MPPRKLTAGEQALVDKWVPSTVYFMKMMRRADRYLATVPKDLYTAAYKEVFDSGLVTGVEGKPRDPNDQSSLEPKQQDREAYVQHMKDLIERHPITSANNAVTVLLAGNGGSMCVDRLVFIDGSERAQQEYQAEVYKLKFSDADLKEVRDNEELMERNNPGSVNNNAIVPDNFLATRHPDDRPINNPFIRAKPMPDFKLSTSNWQQYEKIGQTFFVIDDDDETGYTAFELAGISIRKSGRFTGSATRKMLIGLKSLRENSSR